MSRFIIVSRAILPPLVILVSILAVFSGALRTGFIWDDYLFILNNQIIHDPGNIPKIFVSGDSFGTDYDNPYYRPLTTSTFVLDYYLWGENPLGYHLLNLLLHAAVCLLLFLALAEFMGYNGALIAAVIFAVHPAHAEPVSYISARADLLCAFFMLGSFLMYLRGTKEPSSGRFVFSLIFYAMALLSKCVAVIFPVVIILHLILFVGKRRKLALVAPYLLVSLAFLAVRSWVVGGFSWSKFPLSTRLATAGPVLLSYLANGVIPTDLKVFYDIPLRTAFNDTEVILSWTILWGILILAAMSARRLPSILLGTGWFFMGLLPVCGIVMILNPVMANRYLYIPLMGMAFVVGAGLECIAALRPFRRLRAMAAVCGTMLILAIGIQTAERVRLWNDPLDLWQTAARDAPDNPVALNLLGVSYAQAGRHEDAERTFMRLHYLTSGNSQSYNNLAVLALQRGNFELAGSYLREAMERGICDPIMMNTLNAVLAKKGLSREENGRDPSAVPLESRARPN